MPDTATKPKQGKIGGPSPVLPPAAKKIWQTAYNNAIKTQGIDPAKAKTAANNALKAAGWTQQNGKWVKAASTSKGTAKCPNCDATAPAKSKGQTNCPKCGSAMSNPTAKATMDTPQLMNGKPDASAAKQIKCPKCGTGNNPKNTKCSKCKAQLPGKAVMKMQVEKVQEDEGLAFGWAYVSELDGQPVADYSGENVPIKELEKGAYLFNKSGGVGGEMHLYKGCSSLIESMVFTKEKYEALGIDPEGRALGWWIGMECDKESYPEVWGKVKSGEYSMFSIHGSAVKNVAKGIQVEESSGEEAVSSGASLVAKSKMEVAMAESWGDLSDVAKSYLTLQGSAIRTERMSKGIPELEEDIEKGKGPSPHGPSIKCPDIYEALKREGKSKTNAAQISNECYSDPNCSCH